jgi:uncharacterized membrane protein YjjP (DUF1212 family)
VAVQHACDQSFIVTTEAAAEASSAGAPVRAGLPESNVDPHEVLRLAMRIGDSLLSAGMSANDVVVFALRVTRGYGLVGVHLDVTYTSMSASYYPAVGAAPVTAIRVVRPTKVDYSKVRRLERLATRIEKGLPLAEAAAEIDRIRSDPHPYPISVSLLGGAGLAAAACLLFTTEWKILLLAFLISGVGNGLLLSLDRRQVPPFFRQLFAAAVITLVAAGITWAGKSGVAFLAGVDPTLLVVGGIIMLLSGTMIVGAVQDAIDQFYVTASARVLEVFMRTAGIVAGIVVGLAAAQQLGIPLTLSAEPIKTSPPWAQFTAAALIAATYVITVFGDLVTILLGAAMALVCWFGYSSMIKVHVAEIPADTAAAMLAAVMITLFLRRTHAPTFGLITASLLPLVPGLSLYLGLLQLVGTKVGEANPTEGSATLLHALGVAVGIGAGASLGTFLGRPIVQQMRRITVRARRRGRVVA